MFLGRNTRAILGVLGAIALQSCIADDGSDDNGQQESGVGEVGLGLTLPDGSEVTSVTYVITRNAANVETGSIPVGADGHASKTITGLPVGDGYHVVLTAQRATGAACSGSADFSVTVDQTTQVSVVLECDDLAGDTGSASIDGSFNICPKVTSTSATPARAAVGKSLSVTANARDKDGNALTYAWTAAAGTFSAPSAATSDYTCAAVGNQMLTVSVSDGHGCTKTSTINVSCEAPVTYSSQTPYLVPVAPGVVTKAILTAGDSPNLKPDGKPYRMVGIPDGLGAFDNGDGTFTLISNHELTSGTGIVRAHGAAQAFVSKWTIRKSDLGVLHGEDLIHTVNVWNTAAQSYAPGTVAFQRFCSADLAPVSAWYDAASGLGFNGQIFMNGEEVDGGKAWAHGLDGVSYELPRLGKQAWENQLASPFAQKKTIVIGDDDTTPGQVFVYVGDKTGTGSSVERAGLTNGTLYGISVPGFATEPSATGIPTGTFTLASLGNVDGFTTAQLESAATAAGVTKFNRPEDGAWDPVRPNDYYFVTTNAINAPSRLWRLHFSDLAQPELGGSIEMLLDGSEGQLMLDNIAVDRRGHIMLLEDVGNNAHIGQIFRYDLATDKLTNIAQHDPARFSPLAPGFITQDEEASGIIDATDLLGTGWWLVDVQAHNSIPGELVEGGQYLAIFDPASI